ncbi:MAG: S-layer homology domain-containing protein, partial [Clostridia bacterium]|nr:S-layer homology domain-containing protein [Clostridia bacterium]
TETRETDALEHAWGEWTETKAPTCEEAGEETRTCTREGCEVSETRAVEATGHAWDDESWTETKAPTCEDEGEETRECINKCGETQTRPVEATGHNWGEWEDTADAECGKPGVQTRTCLNECGATETRETDALEHAWGEWTETKAPTCEDEGEETRYCTREGCEVSETRAVKALGHDWSEWTASDDATCGKPGEETRICLRQCGTSETRETAALGHDWGEWEVTTPATCTEAGEETRTCQRENCDAPETATETREVAALGHDFGDWIQTKAPTEDEEGEERRDCSRCDAYETRTLEALGTPFMDEWYWTMVMLHNQSYEIEADAEDGDITPNGVTKVKFAQSIIYTITPDEGYEIEAVYVDGKNVGAVSEYTFKRVTKDHTIYAVCAEIEEEPAIGDEIVSTYVDVDVDDWFYDAVETVTAHGLMNGTGDGKFSPEVSTNRAMLVTILWRIEGEADAEPSAFTDVADDMWYTAAIDWAAANGIVNGYEDGTFGPEKAVTREQVMAILHRYAAYRGVTDDVAVSMIPQYDCSVWAENDVNWADMNGLLDNLGVDVTDMTAEASRAEIAAYLADFCVNVIQ